jgi:hypothetical protein
MSHHNNKRRVQDDDDRKKKKKKQRGGGGKRSRWSKQHLYLVLDDWHKGFSIYKMDADIFDDDSDSGSDGDQLPDTPVLRFEAAAGNDQIYLSTSGTKMFIILNNRCGLVYEADTAALAVGTHAPPQIVFGFGVCMPVGDVLYLLSYRILDTDGDGHHSFEAMSATGAGGGGWAWKTLPSPPPTFTARQIVVSHAVHPDGCTIFMTTAYRDTPGAPEGTYSFNTREATWRWHGACALPFDGQGHFDDDLGAWVGLHLNGHVCACQVISTDFVSGVPPKTDMWQLPVDRPNVYLDHQITKEKMYRNDGCSIRASLNCMGTGRFCLVECVPSKVAKGRVFRDEDGCVLRVTVFGLKYNHKGELQTKNQRSTRSFTVTRHTSHFGPFAFWA